jgi:hypothetical protein
MIKKMKILDDLNIILLILLYFEFLSRSHFALAHIAHLTKKRINNLSQNKNKI